MSPLAPRAALVVFFELSVPLCWFVFHPAVDFWCRHGKAVCFAAVLLAPGPLTAFLFFHRTDWFRCLMAGTRLAWTVAACWAILTRPPIFLEERELRFRLGVSYAEHCNRVPRLLPFARVDSVDRSAREWSSF
jgi:hypothetical protein